MSNREAMGLQQSVCDTIFGNVGDFQISFVDAPEAVNKCLSLIVGLRKRGGSAGLELFLAH